MMRRIAVLIAASLGLSCAAQNDSCANASPFTWYACEEYTAPYPQTATLCYSFITGGDSVDFSYGYFAFCPDLSVTYTLYNGLCDSITSNSTGAFGIAPGILYVVCGTVECGSPGGIREVCTTEQLTLPVEFLGMTGYATDGGVVLEWRTATERDSRWFEVLRSIDLAHWDSLCELPAAGNSYSTKVYRWTDIDPELGLAYYRLDGIDIDGSKTMLMILPITWHGRSGSSLGPWDLLGRRIK